MRAALWVIAAFCLSSTLAWTEKEAVQVGEALRSFPPLETLTRKSEDVRVQIKRQALKDENPREQQQQQQNPPNAPPLQQQQQTEQQPQRRHHFNEKEEKSFVVAVVMDAVKIGGSLEAEHTREPGTVKEQKEQQEIEEPELNEEAKKFVQQVEEYARRHEKEIQKERAKLKAERDGSEHVISIEEVERAVMDFFEKSKEKFPNLKLSEGIVFNLRFPKREYVSLAKRNAKTSEDERTRITELKTKKVLARSERRKSVEFVEDEAGELEKQTKLTADEQDKTNQEFQTQFKQQRNNRLYLGQPGHERIAGGVLTTHTHGRGRGTVGSLLCDPHNKIYAISCAHVWERDGDEIQIGGVYAGQILTGIKNANYDVAIAELDPALRVRNAEVEYDYLYTDLVGAHPMAGNLHAPAPHAVRKVGARTHYTEGYITAVRGPDIVIESLGLPQFLDSQHVLVPGVFTPQNEQDIWTNVAVAFANDIQNNHWRAWDAGDFFTLLENRRVTLFSFSGDSGSVVFSDHSEPLCLLYSGAPYLEYQIERLARQPLGSVLMRHVWGGYYKFVTALKDETFCLPLQRQINKMNQILHTNLQLCTSRYPVQVIYNYGSRGQFSFASDLDMTARAIVDEILDVQQPLVRSRDRRRYHLFQNGVQMNDADTLRGSGFTPGVAVEIGFVRT